MAEEEISIFHVLSIVGSIGGLITPQRLHFSFFYRTTKMSLFLGWEHKHCQVFLWSSQIWTFGYSLCSNNLYATFNVSQRAAVQ